MMVAAVCVKSEGGSLGRTSNAYRGHGFELTLLCAVGAAWADSANTEWIPSETTLKRACVPPSALPGMRESPSYESRCTFALLRLESNSGISGD